MHGRNLFNILFNPVRRLDPILKMQDLWKLAYKINATIIVKDLVNV